MADRRLPYARTLAVLRVLSWPYRVPPLSWMVAALDWLSDTWRRFFVTIAVCVVVVLVAAVIGRG